MYLGTLFHNRGFRFLPLLKRLMQQRKLLNDGRNKRYNIVENIMATTVRKIVQVIDLRNFKIKLMKKSLIAVAFVSIFAACNSNPKTSEQTNAASADTAGLAQFKVWKQQQAIQEQLAVIDANGVNDRLNNANNLRLANRSTNLNMEPENSRQQSLQ
jgi:hypothetical protein